MPIDDEIRGHCSATELDKGRQEIGEVRQGIALKPAGNETWAVHDEGLANAGFHFLGFSPLDFFAIAGSGDAPRGAVIGGEDDDGPLPEAQLI